MKKIFALLLAMTMIVGVAFALEGLSVGAEYRIGNFDADPLGTAMDLRLDVNYEDYFMNDALEIEAEVGFLMNNFDDMTNDADIELEIRYNFTPAFQVLLNSWTLIPFDKDVDVTSWLTPGLKYKHGFGFGDLYVQADVPMYLAGAGDALDIIGLNFTISLFNERKFRGPVNDFPLGFGGEIALYNILDDQFESDFLQNLTITPFFGAGLWYAEVEVGLPLVEDGFDHFGLTITPKFEIDLPPVDGLSLWLDLPVSNIGAEEGDVVIGLGFGVNFKF